jgi:hypothetical protein
MSWQPDIMVSSGSIPLMSTNIITMITKIQKAFLIQCLVDDDNDLYELTINNSTYTLDNVYDSPYGNLFDELNILIDTIQ